MRFYRITILIIILHMASKLYSFRESSLFTQDVYRYLTEESYFALQDFLLEYPMEGDLIQGSGGLRKLRWKVEGRGKRGGARIIYYFADARGHIYLLDIYLNPPKNTPSIAAGLDGDEFGIVGASPTINSCYNTREYDLKSFRVSPKGFPI
jgi:mRNA-degrading endonuclease RelE of RelBE toxin-antitoxin system